jgi:Derlin-2/3
MLAWFVLSLVAGSSTALQFHRQSPLFFPRKSLISSLNSLRGGETIFSTSDRDNDSRIADSFTASPLLNTLTEGYLKTPPVSRLFMSSTFLLTLLSLFFNQNQWPEFLSMNWNAVSKFQFWRLITGFLYFGPFGLNYLLTMQFIWQYLSQIEKLYFNQPERFLLLLGFGASSLLLSYFFLNLSPPFLGHNLCAYLVYIWSRKFEGTPVNLMGIATVPAELLPWLFCLQSLLIDGSIPWTDFLGILAGHLYLLSEKGNWINPPAALVRWARTPFVRNLYRRYSRDFE